MIDTLIALYHIAEQENIKVDCFELRNRDALSMKDKDGLCYIAIDPLKLTGHADEKIKLAHELGHCITGSFYNRYSALDIRQKHEHRADKWAIKKLVPKDELLKAIKSGHINIWDLAEYFNVTEDFMRKAVYWYTNGNLAME